MTNSQPLRVLFIEDSQDDFSLVIGALKRDGYVVEAASVATRAEMEAQLQAQPWDVVLADYTLPHFSAPEALTLLQRSGHVLPFIIVSGTIDEEQAVTALRAGAHDFVTKSNLARLAPAIERALREAAERRQSRAAHEALQAMERRFRALIERSADAITLVSETGAVVYDSPAAPRLLGYGPDEFIGRSVFELIHPDDLPGVQAQLQQLLEAPALPQPLLARLRHAGGQWRWMEGVATNLLADPSVRAIVVNYRDITERRRAEEQLHFQARLLETVGQAVMATSLDGTITYWNRSAERLYGWPAAEALGRNVLDVTPTDASRAQAEAHMGALRAGQSFTGEFMVRRRDGTQFPIQVTDSPIYNEAGAIIGLIGISDDISARRQAEAELSEERDLLASVMETSPVGITRVDRDGRIVFANARAEEVLGLSRSELTNLTYNAPVWRITAYDGGPLPDDELPFERVRAALQPVYGLRHAIVWPNGRRVLLTINAAPLFDAQGAFAGMVAALHDVTELLQAEAALRASDRRFRALIENSADGLTLSDRDGRLIYRAPSSQRLTGYADDARLGGHLTDLVHPDDVPALRALLSDVLAEPRRSRQLTYRLRHQAGHWRWLEVTFTNQLEEPDVNAIVANYRDITDRRQAEEKVQRQVDYLSALREIDRAISASFDLRLSLSLLLSHLTAQLGVDAGAVLIYNRATTLLELVTERGFRVKPQVWTRLRLGEGYAGRAALERRAIHFADVTAQSDNPAYREFLSTNGFVGYHALPLIAKGEVRGVLEVFQRARPASEPALHTDPEWIDFLQTLAAQAAIAIDNAALLDGLQRSNLELARAYDENIEAWARALDLRDQETEGHSRRVTEQTLALAEAFRLSPAEQVHVRRGALLHDIGKMGIPDSILLKPGPLTEEEWVIMRQHPLYAYELLAPIDFLRPALDIPYCHHEKWDGTGYPRGLQGEQIPLAARLFAVVDVWDALRSDRPYRPAWPNDRIRAHLQSLAGTHFDPAAVEAFFELDTL